jgi:tetratricopeptide (TPR) repeat protein
MPYDIFISYSRRDNAQGRIAELVERIKSDFAGFAHRDLVPFFDKHEIQGMQDWRQRLWRGLRESRLILVCLSPSYLQSENCEWEFVEYLKYEIGHLHGFNGVAPIYFVEVPGWNGPGFEQQCAKWVAELRRRQYFDLRPWFHAGEDALRETAVQERMGKLKRQIFDAITRGERAEKSLGNVDAHNPHFIGRTASLRMLRENFVKPGHIGVVTAVNGVGGLGKTALAIEYAHAFADEYGGGRWQVRCAGKDDLRLALAELATPIGFAFTDDEKKNADLQFERTRRELKKLADARAPHRCLLLLDNVDRPGLLDLAQVARLNGGDWLHVLATTRLGENELHGAHRDRSFLAIDELPPDDALALIESYQPDGRFRREAERDAAREIVRLLGSFTLAVESAAVYLGQFANDVTCAAFLARLKKEGLEGLDTAASQSDVSVRHGEKRLGATLQPTLERLGAAEKLTLEFAALLPPDQVPLPWLRALVAKTFPEMEHDAEPGYPDPWKNVTRRLLSLRLIQTTDAVDGDGQPRVVRAHRLLQESVRRKLGDELKQRHGMVVALSFERSENLKTHWHSSDWKWEIGPLVGFTNQLLDSGDNEAPRLVKWLCEWLLYLDRSPKTERLIRRALLHQETKNPGETTEIAITLNNLGVLLSSQARFADAESLLRKALAIDEKYRESNHEHIATRLNNLGRLLHRTNRLAEAELLLRRALAIREARLGLNHTQVAGCLRNLSGILADADRRVEAEQLLRRALAIYEQNFGPDHPEVAGALVDLASLLIGTNRLAEAEQFMRRALAIHEAVFGRDHPEVATVLNNLAILLANTRRPAEAEPLYRRALAISEQNFGPNDPHCAATLHNLAVLLKASNRLAEAEQFTRRALAIDEQVYGRDHPRVATFLNNLASLLDDARRPAEAEPLFRRALAVNEQNFGPNHPRVATNLNNLAVLLKATHRQAEAEPLIRRALAIWESTLGLGHPSTLASMDTLAHLLEQGGRFGQAVAVRQRASEERERTLGPEHLETLRSWNKQCVNSRRQGLALSAEPIDRRVAATTAKMCGDIHPLTIHRRNNLVLNLIMLGKLEEARQILAANWRLKAPPHANTTPHIAFLRHLIALLESQPDTLFLGQLKTLLTGPELPVASDVAVPWDIAYFIEFLKSKLGEHPAEFLTALVAALNDRANLPALDAFPAWRDRATMALDVQWHN